MDSFKNIVEITIAVGISRFPIIDTFIEPMCFIALYNRVSGIISQKIAKAKIYKKVL